MICPSLADVTPIKPTATAIAERLRAMLADGHFTPGQQITEAFVAAAFRVARGPVREALKQLTEQGLLVTERHRGVFVPEISPEVAEDVYLLRGAVESAALRQLVESPDVGAIARLWRILADYRVLLEAQDWDRADELDMAFHREMVHSSRSRRLIHAFGTTAVETRMCLRALVFHHPDHPDMYAWHADILRAVEQGDLPAALKALEFHNATVLADLKRTSTAG